MCLNMDSWKIDKEGKETSIIEMGVVSSRVFFFFFGLGWGVDFDVIKKFYLKGEMKGNNL